jgi:hypothetical protein
MTVTITVPHFVDTASQGDTVTDPATVLFKTLLSVTPPASVISSHELVAYDDRRGQITHRLQ